MKNHAFVWITRVRIKFILDVRRPYLFQYLLSWLFRPQSAQLRVAAPSPLLYQRETFVRPCFFAELLLQEVLRSSFHRPVPLPILLNIRVRSQANAATATRRRSKPRHDRGRQVRTSMSRCALVLLRHERCLQVSAIPFQGSHRTFFNSLTTNLSSSGTRCSDLAFWTPLSVRIMCSSVTHL